MNRCGSLMPDGKNTATYTYFAYFIFISETSLTELVLNDILQKKTLVNY